MAPTRRYPRAIGLSEMCWSAQVINNALLNQPFNHLKVEVWSSTIIENVLKELAQNNDEAGKKGEQRFKYIGALPRRQISPGGFSLRLHQRDAHPWPPLRPRRRCAPRHLVTARALSRPRARSVC